MQSIKSNALEPTRVGARRPVALAGDRPAAAGLRPADPDRPAHHLLLAAPAATPSRPTSTSARSSPTRRSSRSSRSPRRLPMMAGRIDLTVGFGIVMWHILAMWLLVKSGVPWPLAVLIVLACGGAGRPRQRPPRRGRADRLLHRHPRHRHHALRAGARGSPTAARSSASLPPRLHRDQHDLDPRHSRSRRSTWSCIAIVLWIVSERLPLGRHIYAIGANEKAAALNGIPVRAYVIGVFVASGADRRLRRLHPRREAPHRPGQCRPRLSAAGAGRRLPRHRPRSSRGGSMSGARSSASLILAVGISGIQQLGGAFFVEPLFNGTTLVISIALAAFAQRRRAVGDARRAGRWISG